MSERIDTTTAAGKMVFRMLAVLAEFERNLVSERTAAALAHKRGRGEVYGPVPLGYENAGGVLVSSTEEAQVLTEILKRHEVGEGFREIARDLNDRGVPTKRGARWHASTIRYIARGRKPLPSADA